MGSMEGFGAEIFVLGGNEGLFGVNGSSGVDRDDVETWELSSARTTIAGVPLVDKCFE